MSDESSSRIMYLKGPGDRGLRVSPVAPSLSRYAGRTGVAKETAAIDAQVEALTEEFEAVLGAILPEVPEGLARQLALTAESKWWTDDEVTEFLGHESRQVAQTWMSRRGVKSRRPGGAVEKLVGRRRATSPPWWDEDALRREFG